MVKYFPPHVDRFRPIIFVKTIRDFSIFYGEKKTHTHTQCETFFSIFSIPCVWYGDVQNSFIGFFFGWLTVPSKEFSNFINILLDKKKNPQQMKTILLCGQFFLVFNRMKACVWKYLEFTIRNDDRHQR